jgi:hypothetical protein
MTPAICFFFPPRLAFQHRKPNKTASNRQHLTQLDNLSQRASCIQTFVATMSCRPMGHNRAERLFRQHAAGHIQRIDCIQQGQQARFKRVLHIATSKPYPSFPTI